MENIINNFKKDCELKGIPEDERTFRIYWNENHIVIIENKAYKYKFNNPLLENYVGVSLKIIKETEKAFGLSDEENSENLIWIAKSTLIEIK